MDRHRLHHRQRRLHPAQPTADAHVRAACHFTACIAGFTLASVLGSTAHSLELLVAFRFLQGAFGGGLIATSQGVMRDTFPQRAVGTSSALFSIALIAGPALGPLAGGYLTDNFSWPWIFFVNLVPGVIASATLFVLLRDPLPPQPTQIDWRGVALLVAGFGAMQYVLDNGERRSPHAARRDARATRRRRALSAGERFALTAISMAWLDESMTSASPFGALALPLALSGLGQSMLLVPLIIGVLSTMPAQLNDKIAPLVTLPIQLGGSIASASSIAFFDRRTSLHADVIAGATALAHLGTTGIAPTLAFLTRLAGVANQQATTMGFADTLVAVGLLAALATPMVLLFPRSRRMT